MAISTPRIISLSGKHRALGVYICGLPGSGKSSLISHLILKDICAGRGVAVIDPTGDLLKPIIQRIPKSRLDDVVYFTTSKPQPIDFLSPQDDDEQEILLDDMVAAFDVADAKVAAPMLYKMILTILEANETLKEKGSKKRFGILDLNLFIKNPNAILSQCSAERHDSWTNPAPSKKDFETVLHRLLNFQEKRAFKTVLTPSPDALNIGTIMGKGQIFLVSIKDTKSDFFLAALIVSKIRQIAWRQRYVLEKNRVPYYLYLDECHTILKFAARDFETILTRARKYRFCITAANQVVEDLPKEIREKLTLFGTRIEMGYCGIPYRAECITPEGRFVIETPHFMTVNEAQYDLILQKLIVEKSGCEPTEDMLELKDGGNNTEPTFARPHKPKKGRS